MGFDPLFALNIPDWVNSPPNTARAPSALLLVGLMDWDFFFIYFSDVALLLQGYGCERRLFYDINYVSVQYYVGMDSTLFDVCR